MKRVPLLPKLIIETLNDFHITRLENEVYELTTPFLDIRNDYINIYIEPYEDGYIISDDGYIQSELQLLDKDIKQLKTSFNIFNIVDNTIQFSDFEVIIAENELIMKTKLDTIREDVLKFLKVVLALELDVHG